RSMTIDSDAYEQVSSIDDTGCVVAFGFPRYLSEIMDIVDLAKERGCDIVMITDSPFSPLRGSVTLYAPVESASFFAFHCAPLVLIATLLSEIARGDPERTLAALDRFETLAERQGLFKQASKGRKEQ